MLRYDDKAPQIPAAALSLEHAALLHRLYDRGKTVRVHLEMNAKQLPDVPSANVVGELRGGSKPEEVVVAGGHLDSWDVGQGSQDDGVGCVLSMEAVRLVKAAGLHPKRTLRVVLFTNEENGARGAEAYAETHKAEAANHVALLESDSGNGRISGFSLDLAGEGKSQAKAAPDPAADAKALAFANQIAPLLASLGADHMSMGGSGVDVGPMVALGALGFGAGHDASHYFDIHHSQADTFDKINQADLAHNAHAMAVLLYALADMDQRPAR
jgi:Zn-dependent M28 family amino/carboxypeptidase